MEADEVRFICIAAEHLRERTATGTVSVVAGLWAFCPSAQLADHRWSELAKATSVELLRHDWRPHVPEEKLISLDAQPPAKPSRHSRSPRSPRPRPPTTRR